MLSILFSYAPDNSFLADFYQPFNEDELEQSTVVTIVYEMDPKPVRLNDLKEIQVIFL